MDRILLKKVMLNRGLAAIIIFFMNLLKGKWGNSLKREQRKLDNKRIWDICFKKYADNIKTSGKRIPYIESQQGEPGSLKCGARTVDINGCGPIAIFNMLLYQNNGKLIKDLPDIICETEEGGLIFGGRFGSAPGFVASLSGGSIAREAKAPFIMLIMNNKHNIFKGLHYTCVTPGEKGRIHIHNSGFNSRESYESVEELLMHMGQCNKAPVCFIG